MRLWLSCRLRRKVKDLIIVKGKSKVRDKVKVTLKVKLSFLLDERTGILEYQEGIQWRNTKNVYEIQVRYSGIPSRFLRNTK